MPVFEWKAPAGLNMSQTGLSVPETDCIRLINFLPRPGYLEARKGTTVTTNPFTSEPLGRITGTGFGFPVTVIAEHRNGSVIVGTDGSSASANHTLYIVPASLSWTGNRAAAFTTAVAGTYYYPSWFDTNIIFTRSGLAPVFYDGTTITAMTITGLTASDLDTAVPFKGRMYYTAEANKAISGNFYYAAAGAFQGALTAFPAGQNYLRGGSVFLLVPLSIDGGDGPDDLLCAISDNGECLVYSGDDPGSATDWSLVGRFDIGRPVGKQCWAKVGSTTIIATEHGPIDLQAVLSAGEGALSAAVSPKIAQGVLTTWDNKQTVYDAQLIHDGNERALYWISRGKLGDGVGGSFRLVSAMDTNTREWTQIVGWGDDEFNPGIGGAALPTGSTQSEGGASAAVVNGVLVLGNTLGRLFRANAARTTAGAGVDAISGDAHDVAHEVLTGYSHFSAPGTFKQATSIRILVSGLDANTPDTATTPGFVYFPADWQDIQREPPGTIWDAPDAITTGYPNRNNWYTVKSGQGRRLACNIRIYTAGGWRLHGWDVDFTVTAETSGKR